MATITRTIFDQFVKLCKTGRDENKAKCFSLLYTLEKEKSILTDEERRKLNEASACLLSPELNDVIHKLNMTDYRSLLASRYFTDIDDLIRLINSDQKINSLGFPPELVIRLRSFHELHVEVVKEGGRISPKMYNFCSRFGTVCTLRASVWSKIEREFNNNNMTYDEIELIKKIWSCKSEMCQLVFQYNLPLFLVDKISEKGYTAIHQMTIKDVQNLYAELNDVEQKALQKLWKDQKTKTTQEIKDNSVKRGLLREKIQDGVDVLHNMTSNKNRKQDWKKIVRDGLSHLQDDLGFKLTDWPEELFTKPERITWELKQLKTLLLCTPAFMNTSEDGFRTDKEVICQASEAKALCAIHFGIHESSMYHSAKFIALACPDECPIKLPEMKYQTESFHFTERNEVQGFMEALHQLGCWWKLAMGGKSVELSHSCSTDIENGTRTAKDSPRLSHYFFGCWLHIFPTGLFCFPSDEMVLSTDVRYVIASIRDHQSAEKFLLQFGSHVVRGNQHLGGILLHAIEIETEKPMEVDTMEKTVEKEYKQAAAFGYSPFASGDKRDTKISSNGGNRKSVTLNAKIRFVYKALGPDTPNVSLFKKCLDLYNSTWHIIDRGSNNVIPIWEVLLGNFPDLDQTANFLKGAWMNKVNELEDKIKGHCRPRADTEAERSRLKPYSYLLTDRIFSSDLKHVDSCVLMWDLLRYRLNIQLTIQADQEEKKKSRRGLLRKHPEQQKKDEPSLVFYDTLLELVESVDVAARTEIFRLLLERRSAVPLFLPSGQHHLSLLRLVSTTISNNIPVNLVNDQVYLRVTLVSCRDKKRSRTTSLLKSIFHIHSIHKIDWENNQTTKHSAGSEIGCGFLVKNGSPVPCIVVHFIGDFAPFWSFIEYFTDYLLVEDEHDYDFRKLAKDRQLNTKSINDVTLWLQGDEFYSYLDEQEQFYCIKGPPDDKTFQTITEDVLDTIEEDASPSGVASAVKRGEKRVIHACPLSDQFLSPPCAEEVLGKKALVINTFAEIKNFEQLRADVFLLQKGSHQSASEEEDNSSRDETDQERQQLTERIILEQQERQKLSHKVTQHPLLKLLVSFLWETDSAVRVLSIRELDNQLVKSNNDIHRKYEDELGNKSLLYNDLLKQLGHENNEVETAKREWHHLKDKINNSVVSLETLWRELSHAYGADTKNHQVFPTLAAQHLLDGFPLELFDGDSCTVNLDWITAVFQELEKKMGQSKRIFVLSVLGVQSSGKSTLLNTMFGVRFRTSVGQCTRGVSMSLIRVENRSQYDYVLLLDSEGIRAPEYWGIPGSTKRDNRMATFTILPADATIIVNSGENDAAIKEILPVVLLAYNGSRLAEENGGQLSSMVFFVYNRIDTSQSQKMNSVLQTLGTTLNQAFAHISGGKSSNIFRGFELNSGDANKCDVKILGNIKHSFEAPNDTPDPAYGQGLLQFREYIHRRVVGYPKWKARTISDMSKLLELVWDCICSSDFNLNFATIIERQTHDKLEAQMKEKEMILAMECGQVFSRMERDLLLSFQQEVDINEQFALLEKETQSTRQKLGQEVQQLLAEKDYGKWNTEYVIRWEEFINSQRTHFRYLLEQSINCNYKFDQYISHYKHEMHSKMMSLFASRDVHQWEDQQYEQEFDSIFNGILKQVKEKHKPINVRDKVAKVYLASNDIRKRNISITGNMDSTEFLDKLQQIRSQKQNGGDEKKGFLGRLWSSATNLVIKKDNLHASKSENKIVQEIDRILDGKKHYSDGLVESIISSTDQIINEKKPKTSVIVALHNFAQFVAIEELVIIQQNWEGQNSVYAKLNNDAFKNQMRNYFSAILRGMASIHRTVGILKDKLKDQLILAFKRETIRGAAVTLRKQSWLQDPNAMADYIDLHLIRILEEHNVLVVLNKIRDPQQLYSEALLQWIENEIRKQNLSPISFKQKLTENLRGAISSASSVTSGRFKQFLAQMYQSCLDSFQDNTLAQCFYTEMNGGNEYDTEEPQVFSETCSELCTLVEEFPLPAGDVHWIQEVAADTITFMKEVEQNPAARPRCNAKCPLCGALCIYPANHDTDRSKHDTFHQPRGIVGITWNSPGSSGHRSLVWQSCSSCEPHWQFDYGSVWYYYKDYSNVFPEWLQPRPLHRRRLREHLFAEYNKAIASFYCAQPSISIPRMYFSDLTWIRNNLIHKLKGVQNT